jgi:hypothetical protein
MSFTVDITDAEIFTALRAFILGVIGETVSVVRGQDNRVVEPAAADFVVLTQGARTRLATTVATYDVLDPLPTDMAYATATDVAIQIDVHGPNSADNVQAIVTLFRSTYGATAFPDDIRPMYCDPAQQVPFLNAENQYENRWVTTAHIQVTPTVSTPQAFAGSLAVEIALAVDLEPV